MNLVSERRVALPLEEATRCVPYYLDGPSCPVGTCLYSLERNSTLQNIKLISLGVLLLVSGTFYNLDNIFLISALYFSTPGWSKGFTPARYPERVQALSKKYTN